MPRKSKPKKKRTEHFSQRELELGRGSARNLNRARKEMAIGVKPSTGFKGGLSPWERGLKKKLKKGKKT